MDILYVPYGVANNFGSYIELNQELKKFPKLHDSILKHELQHTQKGFLRNLVLDFTDKEFMFERMRFLLITPSARRQFNPFYKSGNKRFLDVNLLIAYGSITLFFIIAIVIIIKIF